MVVISIIGLMSSVVLSALSDARAKARDAKRIQLLKEYEKAITFFYDKYGRYPDNQSDSLFGFSTNISSAEIIAPGGNFESLMKETGFLNSVQADPLWNTSYPTSGNGNTGQVYENNNNEYYMGYRYDHGLSGCDPILYIHKFESSGTPTRFDPGANGANVGGYQDIDDADYAICPVVGTQCYQGGFNC